MAAFATHADLAVRLGEELDANEQARATALLGLASDLVRRAGRQRIEKATSTAVFRSPSGRLLLPERPVVSIDAVAGASSWELDGDYLVGSWHGPVEVTYTHGFDPIPEAIKAITLEAVVRVWVNPGNAAQEAYGSERVSHGGTSGLILTSEERRAVRDVVRRGSQSMDIK